MATLTVRNLADDIVRQLRIQAAVHGRSAEAEHREILRATLGTSTPASAQQTAAAKLAAFRQRTANRGATSSQELLAASRTGRERA